MSTMTAEEWLQSREAQDGKGGSSGPASRSSLPATPAEMQSAAQMASQKMGALGLPGSGFFTQDASTSSAEAASAGGGDDRAALFLAHLDNNEGDGPAAFEAQEPAVPATEALPLPAKAPDPAATAMADPGLFSISARSLREKRRAARREAMRELEAQGVLPPSDIHETRPAPSAEEAAAPPVTTATPTDAPEPSSAVATIPAGAMTSDAVISPDLSALTARVEAKLGEMAALVQDLRGLTDANRTLLTQLTEASAEWRARLASSEAVTMPAAAPTMPVTPTPANAGLAAMPEATLPKAAPLTVPADAAALSEAPVAAPEASSASATVTEMRAAMMGFSTTSSAGAGAAIADAANNNAPTAAPPRKRRAGLLWLVVAALAIGVLVFALGAGRFFA